MEIVYHSSNSFVMVLASSIVSLLENNKECSEINIYIITSNITEENKIKLNQLVKKYEKQLIFLPMPDITKKYFENIKYKYRITDAYSRLYLGSILPKNLNKVIYLDADTLVLQPLEKLWNQDINNYYFAGVMECLSKKYYEIFNLQNDSYYCNSGMLLINLQKWRQDKLEDKIIKYIRDNEGYTFFYEQTVLNVVCANKILLLPQEYNVQTNVLVLSYKNNIRLRWPYNWYSEKNIDYAKNNIVIAHLTTFFLCNRPHEKASTHPLKKVFLKYKMLTPWKDEEEQDVKIGVLKKIVRRCAVICPILMMNILGFIYNIVRINLATPKGHKILKYMGIDR